MAGRVLNTILRHLRKVADPARTAVLNDGQLLHRFRAERDEAAFEVLVWRYGGTVLDVCRRLLQHEQDAEDAFQATFLILARKAASIGKSGSVGSWLYKVAYRLALAARTRSSRHRYLALPREEVPAPASRHDHGWVELRPILAEEIERLPDKYRRPVCLCYLEGKTTQEAALELGCPRGTVGTRLARARERLRLRLSRRGVALSASALLGLLAAQANAAVVSASLVTSTVQAGMAFAAGPSGAGLVAAPVLVLAKGGLQAMFLTKLKCAAIVSMFLGLLGLGAGVWTHQAWADPAEIITAQDQPAPAPAAPQNPEEAIRKALEEFKKKQEEALIPRKAEDGRREQPEREGDENRRRDVGRGQDGKNGRDGEDGQGGKGGKGGQGGQGGLNQPREGDPIRRDGDAPRDPNVRRDGDAPRDPNVRRDGDAPRDPNVRRDGDAPRDPKAPRDGDVPRDPKAPRDGDVPRERPDNVRGDERRDAVRARPGGYGVVQAVDAANQTLTIAVRRDGDQGPVEETYAVIKDAEVKLDGENRQLADVPVGSQITIYFRDERKNVVGIRGEGPSVFGIIRAVDAAKNTITLAGGDNRPDQTYELAAGVKVLIPAGDERAALERKLTDLEPGSRIQLKLSIDRKKVRAINIGRGNDR
jgi:RNA polymerase sigma factor (sigma-70 family)